MDEKNLKNKKSERTNFEFRIGVAKNSYENDTIDRLLIFDDV